MYQTCVSDGACDPPSSTGSRTQSSYYGNSTYADYPVIYVSWNDASAYFGWVGARLPSEAEWEKAARGTDGRAYPWGYGSPTCSLANYAGCEGDTGVVGSYPLGASPYGTLDMAGNVYEWVNDWYGTYPSTTINNPQGPSTRDYRVLRGGSWFKNENHLRSALRNRGNPGRPSDVFGFRCARSQP